MNINGDQWRAGSGCRWMAFCSASDSSTPLMGSAWLDSIMSPDTLWRGCKLSIRPLSSLHASPSLAAAVFPSFLMIILPSFTLLTSNFTASSYSPLHINSASCFPVSSASICCGHIDMNFTQVEWHNEHGEGHAYRFHQYIVMCAIALLGSVFESCCYISLAF